jgi:anoctamin-1
VILNQKPVAPQKFVDFDPKNFHSQGTFDDWVEIVVLFGDVTLFSVVFPLAPFLVVILSLIEIRIDAYKVRKPIYY